MLRKRATGSLRREGRHNGRNDGVRVQRRNGAAADGAAGGWMSRRKFLQRSGIAAIGVAALDGLHGSMVVKAAERTSYQEEGKVELKKTVCPSCAVGCSIWAEVQNGVWTGQEPVFESPVNMGTHCAKGAATRELVLGERRLKRSEEHTSEL